jgi:hypothetical protein
VDDAKFRRLTAHIQVVHQSDALANESEAGVATGISISGPIFKIISKSTAAAEWSSDCEITCQFSVAYTPIISLVDCVASESQHPRD